MQINRILWSCLVGALAHSAAWAVVLPVQQDTSSSSSGALTTLAGKSTSLSIASNKTALVQFDLTKLPPGVSAQSFRSARLRVYTPKVTHAGDVYAYFVNSAWNETTASAGPSIGGGVGTFVGGDMVSRRFLVADVSYAVYLWLTGSANNGLALQAAASPTSLTLSAKEGASTGEPAELEIDYDATVSANGAVGIGTTNPTDGILDVEGDTHINDATIFFRGNADRNHGVGWFGSGKPFANANIDGPALFGYSGGALGTRQETGPGATNIALQWTSAGNVYINHSSVNNAKLNVNTGGYSDTAVTVQAGPSDNQSFTAQFPNGHYVSHRSYGLELSHDNAFKPGGGAWGVYSDARLKKNVENLQGALDRLLQLRSVSYEYKDPAAIHELPGRQIGFVAQEVEKVFPEWVGQKPDGYKFLAIKSFESLTVAALRELRTEKDEQIKTLATENSELKQRMKELEERDDARTTRLTALEKSLNALVAQKAETPPARTVGAKSE